MSSEGNLQSRIELFESALTLPSDSETYAANNGLSPSPEPSSNSVVVYQPPTIWRFLRSAAINLLLPFINGLMLGFGELFAHEAAFRLGWSNTKVFPTHRRSRPAGAGIESPESSRQRRSRSVFSLQDMASLE
ncbi:hypothetical protein D8B26_006194 [Coccidioides posadasii str. Silveira]|uniref:Mitochondrial import protein 1 n=5 Tax=Coccidioides TaxID=5500 RepID=E9DBD0_COCPS|nr:hypothetical protein CPC735_030420 [Coccidioides posadasii C735 delta SOWgp]EFW16082.1 mitochondrial import protein 1 [Coccidioides posadasii str. Silveira]KMM67610.1 hypothetical protein CPAG_03943 [Coccidioides posadasii RMSCC 3488]KMU74679.1 hypothetical protein CISG_00609 [Coccidioides immitis RMSCC 3703]KMU83202.1 hypothetical protein CIHG_00984 [Coccidioides immitis H538.4]TPX23950.1 hypothetical protein DIZ76_013293 [Coccidioides immitis]|eukprot:XP_003069851.1 hypothetical protein CPC735_030420 [Coccidioides posadasii C735 delta SOWgp]